MTDVHDLRSALELLKKHPGQYHETDHPVNPIAELAGVYKLIGAGGTVSRPTRLGPAMIFNDVQGYPGWRVLVGLMASRDRVGLLLDCPPRELTQRMGHALANPIAPVDVGPEKAACQEVVHRAEDPDFDLRTLLPAPTNTPIDAGPYFCLGLLLGSDPEEGTDVTIHRMCVQGRDELSIFFAPSRHIDAFRAKAEARGEGLPVSVNMGLDPAIFLSTSFEAPNTPYGFDELTVAGAIRGRGIELARCLTVDQRCIAGAEVVLEGVIQPNVRVPEDQNSHTGHAMPEFPGYVGPAHPSLPVLKITAITHRKNPILQNPRRARGGAHDTRRHPDRGEHLQPLPEGDAGLRQRGLRAQRGGRQVPGRHAVQQEEGLRRRPRPLRRDRGAGRVPGAEERDPGRLRRGRVRLRRRAVGDADPLPRRPGHHQHPRGRRARPRPVADPAVQPAPPRGRRHEQDDLRLHRAVPPARRVRPRPVPRGRPRPWAPPGMF